MGRFEICIMFMVALASGRVYAISPLELGMTLAVRAYDLVCWYEKLRQFPSTDSAGFTRDCMGKAEHVRKHIRDDDMGMVYFGDWMIQLAMSGLPSEYGYKCNEYLRDIGKIPTVHEGDALNDGQGNDPYPLQGFSYCLINHLRQKFGSKAIDAVKSEKTHQRKHWMSALLDRQNEFRLRNGAEPLLLIKELTDSAQLYADHLARNCRLEGSQYSDRGRLWNGNSTGESLAAGPDMPKEDAALVAANSWYEEMKDYPLHRGYMGGVWKNTGYVGYGLGYNENCDKHKWYIVARYGPQRIRYYEYYRH